MISFLLSGRSSKRVALFFSISPKTVENHTRNIMGKLGCNSRESIIDFIEKSNQFSMVKKYYSSLLIDAEFENTLKTLAPLKEKPSVITINCQSQESPEITPPLLQYVEEHLRLLGINLKMRFHKKLASFLSSKQIESSNAPSLSLLSDNHDISPSLLDSHCFELSQYQNYYGLVFALLQKCLPHQTVEDARQSFQKKFESVNTALVKKNLSHLFEEPQISKLKSPPMISKKVRGSLALLFLGTGLGGVYLKYQNSQILKDNIHQPQLQIQSDLALPHASVFLKREKLLDQIKNKIKAQKDIRTLALVGIGGAGKTTIARQYARLQRPSVAWEMNAETEESLKNSFENLAVALTTGDEERKVLKSLQEIENQTEKEKRIIRWVQDRIRLHKNWLIIYDNVVDFKCIRKYCPHNKDVWGSGQVIITTRNNQIQSDQNVDEVLQVPELNEEQKLSLFTKIIISHSNTPSLPAIELEEIRLFLKSIPPYPLDLTIAAHYLKKTNTSYKQYLTYLKMHDSDFQDLQKNVLRDSGMYNQTRYEIIALALKEIIKAHKDFTELLLFISLLDRENIPRGLLDAYKKDIIVDKFIYHLEQYSLLTNKNSFPTQENSLLSIHPSVQEHILLYVNNNLGLAKNAHQSISSIAKILEQYVKDAIEKENLSQMSSMGPHLRAFLSHEALINDNIKGAIEIELGCIYYYTHFQEVAKKFLESGISRLSSYPCKDNYSKMAQALSFLGNSYKEIGEHQKARDLLKKSLLLYKQHNPQNYRGIMRALATLGDTYKNLGDLQKAKDSLIKSLSLADKHEDSNLLEVARTMLYLGIVYRDLGEYAQSIPLLKNSLSLFKKYENPIERARALKYLANTYRNLGRYEEARALLEESVLICKKYLPENDIALGRSLVHLATIYKNLGEYKKAQNLLKESLQIHQRVFGKDSVRTAWVVVLLANMSREMGEYKEAEESIKSCLKTYLEAYGEDSLRTSWVFMQLGLVYENLKKDQEAKETLEKVLVFHQKHFKEDHLKIAYLSFYLGNAYTGLGLYEKAQELLVKSLKIYEKHYGKDHMETAKILGSLGHLQICKENLDEADTLLKRALEILKCSQHPAQFLVYENLAELHLRQAKIEKNKGRIVEAQAFRTQAINELKQALTLTQNHFPQHSDHTKRMSATLNVVINSPDEA